MDWNKGPTIVANATSGRILSTNFKAKKLGITREMKADEASKLCDNLLILKHPEYDWAPGRPDNTLMRKASFQFVRAVRDFCEKYFTKQPIIEWVPSDEIFLDITDEIMYRLGKSQTLDEILEEKDLADHYSSMDPTEVGCDPEHQAEPFMEYVGDKCNAPLYMGAIFMDLLSMYVQEKTGLFCNEGVSTNKMLAKIASGGNMYHHPTDCTILYPNGVVIIAANVPIKKLTPLGAKRTRLTEIQCSTMGALQNWDQQGLAHQFGGMEVVKGIMEVAHGRDDQPVVTKLYNKRIKCTMNGGFMADPDRLQSYLQNLFFEFRGRVKEEQDFNQRIPNSIRLSVEFKDVDSCILAEAYSLGALNSMVVNFWDKYYATINPNWHIEEICFSVPGFQESE